MDLAIWSKEISRFLATDDRPLCHKSLPTQREKGIGGHWSGGVGKFKCNALCFDLSCIPLRSNTTKAVQNKRGYIDIKEEYFCVYSHLCLHEWGPVFQANAVSVCIYVSVCLSVCVLIIHLEQRAGQ